VTSSRAQHLTVSRALVRQRGFFRPGRGLRARVRRVASLRPGEVEAMWRLFCASYDGARRADFERDLAEKEHVIVLKDPAGAVQGFSTLLALQGPEPFCAVFSGDTIVAPGHWGQTALQRAFVWYLMAQRLKRGVPVYWFLITKGYRTYLLLARYFPTHWPRHDATTPPFEAALLDRLCRARFGEAWDAQAGLLRYAGNDVCRLSGELADVPTRLLRDPDVAFFLERNPRWREGDELCCLAAADDLFVQTTTKTFL
jgi:hypothetical protein